MIDWTCKNCETIWAEGQRFCRFCDDPNAKIRELEAKLAEAAALIRPMVAMGNGEFDLEGFDGIHDRMTAFLDAAREEKG